MNTFWWKNEFLIPHKVSKHKFKNSTIILIRHIKQKNTKYFRTQVSNTRNGYAVKTYTKQEQPKKLPPNLGSPSTLSHSFQTTIFAQQRKPKQTNLNSSPSSFLVCLTSHIKSVTNLYILNLSRIHSLKLHCLLNSYQRSICLHPLHSCIFHNADSCLFKREI